MDAISFYIMLSGHVSFKDQFCNKGLKYTSHVGGDSFSYHYVRLKNVIMDINVYLINVHLLDKFYISINTFKNIVTLFDIVEHH